MSEQPDHADSSLTETMAARIEIKELGDPARHKEIIDAVEALDGEIEIKTEKGVLHVSFDPLATTEKKIEQAIRSTGNTVKAAAADRETQHPNVSTLANVEQARAKRTQPQGPAIAPQRVDLFVAFALSLSIFQQQHRPKDSLTRELVTIFSTLKCGS